jgi:hypothetical protein
MKDFIENSAFFLFIIGGLLYIIWLVYREMRQAWRDSHVAGNWASPQLFGSSVGLLVPLIALLAMAVFGYSNYLSQ